MDDNSLMPFGQHKGVKLANVPASYLLWAADNLQRMDPNLLEYIRDNRALLEREKVDNYNRRTEREVIDASQRDAELERFNRRK